MTSRDFEIRLSCSYNGPDNAIDELSVETLVEGEWQALDINLKAPGFQMFTYGLLSCQHLYFRLNASEKGLLLKTCNAHMTIRTDVNWNIELLQVDFYGLLKSGVASQQDKDYILERMGFCPVSSNMKDITDNNRTVTFESEDS